VVVFVVCWVVGVDSVVSSAITMLGLFSPNGVGCLVRRWFCSLRIIRSSSRLSRLQPHLLIPRLLLLSLPTTDTQPIGCLVAKAKTSDQVSVAEPLENEVSLAQIAEQEFVSVIRCFFSRLDRNPLHQSQQPCVLVITRLKL
jgi:hypothetical protein